MKPALAVLGVPIRIHWTLAPFILALVIWGQGEALLLLGGAMVLHELGHTLVARALGVSIYGLEITPLGCALHLDRELPVHPARECAVALAGPGMSLLVAMLWVFLDRYRVFPCAWWERFISVNLLLAGANLLPALPLDGGRALRALLSLGLGFARATHITVALGVTLALGVLGCAIYGLTQGIANPTWPALAIFLLLAALREWRQQPMQAASALIGGARSLDHQGAAVHQLAVSGDATIGQVMRRLRPGRYHLLIVLDGRLGVLGQVSEGQLLEAMGRLGAQGRMRQICHT